MASDPDRLARISRITAEPVARPRPKSTRVRNAPLEAEGLERHNKVRRSRTGCLTCRARKVKCDEALGCCDNCRRMEIDCCWPSMTSIHNSPVPVQQSPSTTSNNTSSARPFVSRRKLACLSCRVARSRCTHTKPACDRCLRLGIECEYPPAAPRRLILTPTARMWMEMQGEAGAANGESTANGDPVQTGQAVELSSSADSRRSSENSGVVWGRHWRRKSTSVEMDIPVPTGEHLERLVAAFFLYVHGYGCNAVLHRTKTIEMLRDGRLPDVIELAICAAGARFLATPELPHFAASWARQATNRLMIPGAIMSLTNIQAAIILCAYAQAAGDFSQASLLCSYANRQALGLRLHRGDTTSNSDGGRDIGNTAWTEGEERRRAYFACYCLERSMSDGTPESIYCPAERITIPLPCEGFNYRMSIQAETPLALLEVDGSESERPASLKNVGLLGHYARMCGIRFQVSVCLRDLHESWSHSRSDSPWNPSSPWARCIDKLAVFRRSLPARYRLNDAFIQDRHDTLIFGPLLMLYLWWNMLHVELYRVVLDGYMGSLGVQWLGQAPPGWVDLVQAACIEHARAMASLLQRVETTVPGQSPVVILDPDLPQIVYFFVRIQLDYHRLLHEEEISGQDRQGIDTMLLFLERSVKYFPASQLAFDEIRSLLRTDHVGSPTATLPHPWFQMQQVLDMRREATPNTELNSQSAPPEGDFVEFLPQSMPKHDWAYPGPPNHTEQIDNLNSLLQSEMTPNDPFLSTMPLSYTGNFDWLGMPMPMTLTSSNEEMMPLDAFL